MMRIRGALLTCALILGGCQSPESGGIPTGAEADAMVAEIEAVIETITAGAARVDAQAVLSPAAGQDSLTLIVGDVLLRGYDTILEDFQETYEGLESQEHTPVDRQIRLLGPDVAVALLTAVGTYTDDAGWTSPPVGLGITLVLVRENGRWRLTHAHQSTID